ncbi:MAG: type II toxin-antitoxin system HicB family antitoxin [Acidobacteriota bacterium]
MEYPITLTADEQGPVLVAFPDLPWIHTYGTDETDARAQALDAFLTGVAFLIKERQVIPRPSRRKGDQLVVPPMVAAKVGLHNALLERKLTRAELARRLKLHRPQVDRLFDLDHASKLEQMESAAEALGVRLDVRVVAA